MTTTTLPDATMKALDYEAVLIHPVEDAQGKVSWGWIWHRHGDVVALSPLRYEDGFQAGEDFLSLLDFRSVSAPIPKVDEPTVKPWSLSMALVGQRGVPIYVVVVPTDG